MSVAAATRSPISKRRSNRMGLNAAVGVTGEDRHKSSFSTDVKATNLNRHGAAIHLSRELSIGSTVVLRHPRGTQISARVVAQISAVNGQRTYGVEFVEQDDRAQNFWGISFPSA